MASYAIDVRPDDFLDYYPLFDKTTVTTKDSKRIILKLSDPGGSLRGELDGWVTENINESPNYTTCCIQMTHAINMAFVNTDVSKMVGAHSIRRATHAVKIASVGNKEFHYIAAVDEMKAFLDDIFEPGRKISSRKDIDDQSGIVVFMGNSPWGVHTEVWTGDNFHQQFMKNNFNSLTMPNVYFWSMGDPNLIDI